ncbi:hypothetical protein B7P43_G06233 [Cryptotermes secundus]|uniref:Uncharacterized protein n=1 Tax=Cryptotermes secundus TaxID=105785 RepID=A0A2J7RJT6_9NEOP|nr:hypothetical protein B7P43_G06233 [Cryptotermes secundus]
MIDNSNDLHHGSPIYKNTGNSETNHKNWSNAFGLRGSGMCNGNRPSSDVIRKDASKFRGEMA